MKVSYRESLEKAARQTILIHRPNTLIKLILRTIVRILKVKHAGIIIYDKTKNEYVMKVSRGDPKYRIPANFVKIKKENPIIRAFTDKSLYFPEEIVIWDKVVEMLYSPIVDKNIALKNFLQDLKETLSIYQAKVCIPGFFRNELVGILILGEKQNKREFKEDELGFLLVLASDVVMSLKNAWLIEDLNNQLKENKHLFLQTVSALASSIEAKDKYTIGHTERVTQYSLKIAEGLRAKVKVDNWEDFLENLRIASLLHDIGKIGVPENILNKRGSLNKEEREVVNSHPSVGANILSHIEKFEEVLKGVKYHHERYDGKGYPYHLKKRQIPLIASIISLADAFDAMTTDRPYRKALNFKEAVREINKNRGKQFSPIVVDAFLKTFKNI